MQLYEAMTETPAWQVSDGANFVFFIPYGISHVLEFEKSRSGEGQLGQYIDFICETFDQALLITSENFQVDYYSLSPIFHSSYHTRKSSCNAFAPDFPTFLSLWIRYRICIQSANNAFVK